MSEVPGYLGRVLDGSGAAVGTCFQVRPGVLVTAWHVLVDLGAGAPGGEVRIDRLGAGPGPAEPALARVHAVDEDRDLAVLTCERPLPESVAGLVATDAVAAGVGIAVTGVSEVPGDALRYSSTSGVWHGPAMREGQVPLGQAAASGLAPGMSGGPVRRAADDRVVGVVSGRYNSADGWLQHTVWVARTEDLARLLADVADVPVADAAPRGAPLDLTLAVSASRVRLTGAGVDVAAEHGGLGPGLVNALHDVRRERTRERPLQARAEAGTLAAKASDMSLRRAGELLAESFLPGPVADGLAEALRRAEEQTAPVRLTVDAPGFTGLPWEALPAPVTRQPLALHPLVSVYRHGKAAPPSPLPGPLRIVVAIASPERGGGALLDYERELSSVLDAVRGARRDEASVHVVPFATTAAIRAALEDGPVHVLHLSAHGSPGILHLEDERGKAREVTADQFLDEAVPPGKMPPVISLAACYTDVAGEEQGVSYAARLAERGACAVIATQTSVTDFYATRLFARVYAELASSPEPDVVRAVAEARRIIQRDLASSTEPLARMLAGLDEWSVVTVLAGAPSVVVVDRDRTVPAPPAGEPDLGALLARPVGAFVGRRFAQRHLPELLASDSVSGVVLHGIGGIGKTTLAAEVVRHALRRAPSWRLVTVAGALTVDGVFAAVAAVLRLELLRRGITSGPQTVAVQVCAQMDVPWRDRLALLRQDILSTTPVLLVLDNFEDNLTRTGDGWQVTNPELAGLLAAWVASPGRSRVLFTCRYPFSLPDQAGDRLHEYQMAPLSRAETRKLLWSLPALDTYAVDAEAQEKIWRGVGGHPRSLEYLDALLRAGRGRFSDITRRLHDTVAKRLSAQQATTWLAQDRTLDTAIAQVATLAADDVLLTEHLTDLASAPDAIRLLAGISVYREPVEGNALLFQVGVPDEAAAFVPDLRRLADQLTALLARYSLAPADVNAALDDAGPLSDTDRHDLRQLVVRIKEPPRAPIAAPPHLEASLRRLLDSSLVTALRDGRVVVHRWTASELHERWNDERPELVEEVHRAAAAYWRWRASVWPQDRVSDVHDLEEARHHLLAGRDFETASTLSEHISAELHRWGAWDQESSLIHDTLRWLPEDSPRRPAWHHQLGIIAQVRGDYGEAERRYQQSLTLCEELGDRSGMAAIYHQLGMIAQDRGDYGEAERRYQEALTIGEEVADPAGMATTYHQLGNLAYHRADYDEAERRYHQAIDINEEVGEQAAVAAGYHQLGTIARSRGDYGEAERRYHQALSTAEEHRARMGVAATTHELGNLAFLRGDYGEAERRFQQSLAIKEELGDRAGVAGGYSQLGTLAKARGDNDEAERRYHQALTIAEELGNRAAAAVDHHQLGMVAHARGDYGEAERCYSQALAIDKDMGNRVGAAATVSQLGQLRIETGRPVDAVPLHCQALAMRVALRLPQAQYDLDVLRQLRATLGAAAFDAAAATTPQEWRIPNLNDLLDRSPPPEEADRGS